MKQNMVALLIGFVGAALTLFAYSQTFISPTQCITLGLLVLMLGLLVGEGIGSGIEVRSLKPNQERFVRAKGDSVYRKVRYMQLQNAVAVDD
ncbi:hypothetical protein L6164_006792 [Bauhinia variegata]|uniref:Uncharacterized protein n=1 Tax=Bauhinia variegata TaxID=167791 RepID=A0ACB9PX06_BAUVA|nr:hypothetical protein L6164_006792 [Bauhinia variegata]